jgi:predicted ABC-type ATPase
MSSSPPSLIVIAGPNGAGKSTAARTLLAETLKLTTFVNADVIAQGLAGFAPESVAVEAGRIMLRRLRDLARQRADFAFETTLSGLTLAPWLRELQESGYRIHLIYFWLATPEIAIARVAERVRQGGHDIPQETIRRRFGRSIQNFSFFRTFVTTWSVYDTTEAGVPQLVAEGDDQGNDNVMVPSIWQQIRSGASV